MWAFLYPRSCLWGQEKGVGLGLRRERNEIPKPSGKLPREFEF